MSRMFPNDAEAGTKSIGRDGCSAFLQEFAVPKD